MDFSIIQSNFSIKETMNGIKAKKEYRKLMYQNFDSLLEIRIYIMDKNNKIIDEKIFKGQIKSTVAEIKTIFDEEKSLCLKIQNRIYHLDENDYPMLRMFEFRENTIKPFHHSILIARPKIQLSLMKIPIIKHNSLKRLTIENFYISRIDLKSLTFLKYLKLINTGLESIKLPKKTLEYCNLSLNSLTHCNINSKVLILQSNNIKSFCSEFKYKLLDLSRNPLEYLNANAKCLIIKKTELKSLSCNSTIIIADGSKDFDIGECPLLKFLSMIRCGMNKFSFNNSKIQVFKGSNNYLQSVPKFQNCRYVNLSGNFLEYFEASNVEAIDLSMNQIRFFDFSQCPNIRYINLSFNPIDQKHDEIPNQVLKTICLNNWQTPYFISDKIKTILNHQCKKYSDVFVQYKVETIFATVPIAIFILIKTALRNDEFIKLIDKSLDIAKNSLTLIDFYSDFSDYLYSHINLLDQKCAALFTFITLEEVSVKTFYIPILVYNFAEIKRISKPKYIFSFTNSYAWVIVPLFCPVKYFLKKKSFVLSRENVDINEFFHFMRCFCKKPMGFIVHSSPDFFDLRITSVSPNIIEVKRVLKYSQISYDDEKFKSLNDFLNRCSNLGLSNHDFNQNIRGADVIATFSHTESPIFVFMRFIFISDRVKLIETEKYNLFSIVDFYCKIFGGAVFEKNYGTYIIKFNVHYHAVLFGLKLEQIMRMSGIEISIGIAAGLIFSSEDDEGNVIYIGGPVLNKAARIANIGTGVFCCNCIKLQTSNVYEIYDEGERYLKGFPEGHRIFSIRLAKKY